VDVIEGRGPGRFKVGHAFVASLRGFTEIHHSSFCENTQEVKEWETEAVRKTKKSGKNRRLSKTKII